MVHRRAQQGGRSGTDDNHNDVDGDTNGGPEIGGGAGPEINGGPDIDPGLDTGRPPAAHRPPAAGER